MSKLLLLCFCLTLTLDAQQGYWLIGNYAPVEVKAQTPALIPWDMYTHVNNFAIGPTQNCSIDDRLVKPQIAEFVNAAHRNGKSALITLKDAARGVFFSCTSPKNIPLFLANIVSFVELHRYDGIDLDWEDVPSSYRSYIAQYVDLISRLRARMPGKILTMSVYANAGGHALETVSASSQAKLDRVSVMCYDMDGVGNGGRKAWYVAALRQGGTDGHTACDATVSAFTSRGLPGSKIAIGFPFYGRINPSVTAADMQRTTLTRTSVHYRDLVHDKLRWRDEYKRYDHKYGANYLTILSRNEFVSYGGPEMIDEMVDWVTSSHFGGIMTYTTGYEYLAEKEGDLRYPLTTRIYQRLFSVNGAAPNMRPVSATLSVK